MPRFATFETHIYAGKIERTKTGTEKPGRAQLIGGSLVNELIAVNVLPPDDQSYELFYNLNLPHARAKYMVCRFALAGYPLSAAQAMSAQGLMVGDRILTAEHPNYAWPITGTLVSVDFAQLAAGEWPQMDESWTAQTYKPALGASVEYRTS
jgi:hypothetical protein